VILGSAKHTPVLGSPTHILGNEGETEEKRNLVILEGKPFNNHINEKV